MKRIIKIIALHMLGLLSLCHTQAVQAEEFARGGSASLPTAYAYESWMQFETPDTNTPAVDADGCLNYALAKMSARYNLPVVGADLLSDSYTYYTAFTEHVLSDEGTKMNQVATIYREYLSRKESVWLSGTAQERAEQAYAICAETAEDAATCYVLQMVTASGSDHYVLVDYADVTRHRLYLLDSGSWYVQYLGDTKSEEKGYYITAVHPFQIQKMAGDCDGDFQLTQKDVEILLQKSPTDIRTADANHDGKADLSDAVYTARVLQYQDALTVRCDLKTDYPPLATETTKTLQAELPAPKFILGGK